MTLSSQSFRTSQQQNSFRVNTVIEHPEQFSLKFRIHINKQIAARKEIDSGEWRMHHYVVLRKNDHFPDFSFNAKSIFGSDEKTGQPV